MENLIYQPTKEQVARALLNSGSYLIKDEESLKDRKNWFKWKSGIEAPTYANCRYLMGNAGATAVVVQSLVSSVKNNFPDAELIVGMEAAGIHWSSSVALEMGLPTAFIRKEVKKHGVNDGLFVGSPIDYSGAKIVLVDDLVASGGSLKSAIQCLRNEKSANIIGVQSIINWGFPVMVDTFRNLGVRAKALVSYPNILEEAHQQGIITEQVKIELNFFYKNPKSHKFNFDFLDDANNNLASNF